MTTMSHAISHTFAPLRFGARRAANRSFWRDAGIATSIVLLVAAISVLGVHGPSQPHTWRTAPVTTDSAPFNLTPDLASPQQVLPIDPIIDGVQQ